MFEELYAEIANHPSNAALQARGYKPLFAASPSAKIVIIGQAPGKKAQESGMVWSDASGERLIRWLGISQTTFYNSALIAHMPMDFYYPGKGISGDLPPRPDFAGLWHAKILQQMPSIELIVLIGQYAQKYYLRKNSRGNLTDTVRSFETYAPKYFPIVHPSPLNFRWFTKNAWFEEEVVPALQARVREIIYV